MRSNLNFRLMGRWAAILGTISLVACANRGLPEVPTETATTEGYNYVIGPGDTLDIFVWGYEDLSVTLPVRPDGKITTRLVEDIPAGGKTPSELARDIELEYQNFVKNPTVTVSVNQFVGAPSQQVRVVGAGAEPRTVPYRNKMTLLDLMIEIGGMGEFSSGNRSVLVRETGGERKTFKLRLADLLRKGDISANLKLNPGDIVIIPESWF